MIKEIKFEQNLHPRDDSGYPDPENQHICLTPVDTNSLTTKQVREIMRVLGKISRTQCKNNYRVQEFVPNMEQSHRTQREYRRLKLHNRH